ncbi:uncharacterized protein LOC120678792 isoform X4 [Panicum virgatum]|uniref:uncharacterized protein LOC120678792 isoform X4 n=1 Tax=Panicum virgatum TaxID=38727 RepID=UPI0019D50385|nr:uncharacterized protein LOC120678792 isoform X4 [Panicum virgatum]
MVSVIGKEEGTLARPLLAERKLDSSGVASPISASAPISVPSATGKQRPLLRPPPSFLWPADSSGVASAHQPGQWLEGKNQAIHCIGPALIVKPGQLFGAFMPRQVQGLFHCLVGSCTLVCPWNGYIDTFTCLWISMAKEFSAPMYLKTEFMCCGGSADTWV